MGFKKDNKKVGRTLPHDQDIQRVRENAKCRSLKLVDKIRLQKLKKVTSRILVFPRLRHIIKMMLNAKKYHLTCDRFYKIRDDLAANINIF